MNPRAAAQTVDTQGRKPELRAAGTRAAAGPRGTGATRGAARARGQAFPEFVLILPVFLLLVLGAIDFGRIFFSYIQIKNAAGQGAAFAAVNPTDTAGIAAVVQQERNSQAQRGEGTVTVTTACRDSFGVAVACAGAAGGAGPGNTITVTVAEPFNFLTPFVNGLIGSSFTLSSSASAAVLGLAAGAGATLPSGCTPPTSADFTYTVSDFGISVDASILALPNSGQWAIASYLWDMGDGLDPFPPVTGKTASYTYLAANTYVVSMTVQNPCGEATTTKNVAIGPVPSPSPTAPTPTPTPTALPGPSPTPTPPPCAMTANFNWTSSSKTVNFYGASGGAPAPLTWTWDFGDSSGASGQNVIHTYGNNSNKTVTLTIANGACTATKSYSVKPGNNGP